jgi:hypothetical protein
VRVAGDLVLLDQAPAEQQRIVGAEGDSHVGLEQRAHRHRGGVGRNAERHVGGRADLEGHASGGEPLDDFGILDRPDAMPDPVGVQPVQGGGDAHRADEFAGVRDAQQAGPLGDGERPLEVFRRAAPLVV